MKKIKMSLIIFTLFLCFSNINVSAITNECYKCTYGNNQTGYFSTKISEKCEKGRYEACPRTCHACTGNGTTIYKYNTAIDSFNNGQCNSTPVQISLCEQIQTNDLVCVYKNSDNKKLTITLDRNVSTITFAYDSFTNKDFDLSTPKMYKINFYNFLPNGNTNPNSANCSEVQKIYITKNSPFNVFDFPDDDIEYLKKVNDTQASPFNLVTSESGIKISNVQYCLYSVGTPNLTLEKQGEEVLNILNKNETGEQKIDYTFFWAKINLDSGKVETNASNYSGASGGGVLANGKTNFTKDEILDSNNNCKSLLDFNSITEDDPTQTQRPGGIDWGDPTSVDCDGIIGKDLLDFFNKIFRWIRIIAPIAVILLSSVDFAGAILQDDRDAMKKATSKFIKRLIIAVALFFIPLLLEFILNVFNQITGSHSGTCGVGR